MKVTVEKQEHNIAVLTIEAPAPVVAKAFEKAYRKLANQVNIPGFRRGKAPRNILEHKLGTEAFNVEAFEILLPEAYRQALEESAIEPVSRPEVNLVTIHEGEPCVFTAKVTTKPEVALGEYKGLAISAPVTEVADADVDKELASLRERHAKMVVVENAALGQGDFAMIDFDGQIDGKPFSGGQSKGYPLEVGSGNFIPGFEDQLIGFVAGEEREVKVTFPADYFVPELAGKEAVFSVKVNDIKHKELPELDDEFAKEASEKATLDELRADIREKLSAAAARKDESAFREGAVKQAVANATVEIPDMMVDEQVEHMVQDMGMSLKQRGLGIEKYLEYMNIDMAGLRQLYRPGALDEVKTDLVMETVAKTEAFEISGEEFDQEVAEMAKAYKMTEEQLRKMVADQGRTEAVKDTMLRRKSVQLIVDSAVKA